MGVGVVLLFTAALLPALLTGGRGATAQQTNASLVTGGNYVAYAGATLPVEDALNNTLTAVSAVWWFDRQQGAWAGWNPSLPAGLQAFTTLTSGEPYFIVATRAASWTFVPAATPVAFASVALQPGGIPVGYFGKPAGIVLGLGPTGSRVDAIWHFNAGRQAWEAWNPSLPDSLQAFTAFEPGEVYWFITDGAATWLPFPDASRIAFDSDRTGDRDIFTMNADGSAQTNLTGSGGLDAHPTWSPDGTRLAFISARDGNGDDEGSLEVYVMNAVGSGLARLTDDVWRNANAAWSPDGIRFVFASDRDGNFEIYLMSADGGDPTRLTDDPAEDLWPAWSPDGKQIVFASNRDGFESIYLMNADGSGLTRLTTVEAFHRHPAWSPDGTRIAYSSDRAGNAEIWVMNADGTGQTNVTNSPSDDRQPAWSPDGARIAFTSDRGGNFDIHVMNADGSGQTNISNSEGHDRLPDWTPAPVTPDL